MNSVLVDSKVKMFVSKSSSYSQNSQFLDFVKDTKIPVKHTALK